VNKTEIEYIRKRVNEVVQCTNGRISTKQAKKKKGTGLTDNAKIKQIRDGRAKLIPDYDLAQAYAKYASGAERLFTFFEFETTEKQKEKIAYNASIDNSTEEMHSSVERAGKRLIDDVILEIIPKKDMPQRLEELARMFEKGQVEE